MVFLGGLQISLDMEKVFDSNRRHTVYQALEVLQLPESLHGFAQSLLTPHKYYIRKTAVERCLLMPQIDQVLNRAITIFCLLKEDRSIQVATVLGGCFKP